jgi:CRISPR/Cas system-associated exonuclease Cas4 (RecB family)
MRIPFHGEPLGGLQVMGVLETRAMDFENVVWLSVNDGIFPAERHGSSFIPYSLRKAYGLPLSEQNDAVYAYYFYRLLQRTRRLTLVYNTRCEGLFTGEMSRFIRQLKFDRRFKINERNLVFSLLPADHKPVCIDKTTDIISSMKRYATETGGNKFLSPGAINTYLDCSLRFYFRYIAGLPEPVEVKEEIDMAGFGNLLHRSAQLMYTPFTGKLVSARDIDSLIKSKGRIENYVNEAFLELTGGGSPGKTPGGMNSIISGVICTYLAQLLRRDRDIAPFRVEALEKKYFGRINVNVNGLNLSVNLGGVIDRVDRVQGITRVVDYKTGGDEPDFSSIGSLFARGDPKRRKGVFQTFLYAWLYSFNTVNSSPVTPVLYLVKKFFGDQPLHISEKSGRTTKKPVMDFDGYKGEFEENLRLVVADMFNPQSRFEQAENHDVCKYCPYKKLCHRR